LFRLRLAAANSGRFPDTPDYFRPVASDALFVNNCCV
jgi:hypothetical protein